MNEKAFNLLHEPWIKVRLFNGEVQEVSLPEAFEKAHQLEGLSGELPTQDVAIMRLLLAVLHTVFSRVDTEGRLSPLTDQTSPEEVLDRWKQLWKRGSFHQSIIEGYLQHYEDRFWLFHEKYPFFQIPVMKKSTSYTASKLNGELSESSNKTRIFPLRAGTNKEALTYSEAARWLLYVNAFDDTAAKPSLKGLPSPGAGWLGKLGIIMAKGTNLFETLLLNFILLKNGSDEPWSKGAPIWEMSEVKMEERTEINMPNNPSSLYTLQSRRLCLKRKANKVVGYDLLGGDFFPKENALNEQMTLWRNAAKKETDPPEYHPKRHDPSKQVWRDFATIASQSSSSQRPGIVDWLARLKSEKLIPNTFYQFQIVGVKYGDKDFFVDDIISDEIAFNADLLTKIGEEWASRVTEEIRITNLLVNKVGDLAQNLARSSGNTDGIDKREFAKEQAYFRLDEPFRRWLASIDPVRDADQKEKLCNQWWKEEQRIVRELGEELVSQVGNKALIGRVAEVNLKNKKVEKHFCAPEAYNQFIYRTSDRSTL